MKGSTRIKQEKSRSKCSAGPFISLLVITSFILFSCHKTERNREIFESYEGRPGTFILKLPPSFFLGMINANDKLSLEDRNIGDIDFVKVMFFDQNKAVNSDAGELFGEVTGRLDDSGYEMIMEANSDGIDISAYMLESKGFVTDIMMVVRDKLRVTVIGFSGKLNSGAIVKYALEVDLHEVKDMITLN